MPDDQSLPAGHRETVAATWSLSIDLADELRPSGLARPLLEIAALLDPAGTPTDVLTGTTVRGYLADRVGRPVDVEAAGDALGCLTRLSLITLDLTQPARVVRVHALVQWATRDAVPADRMPGLAWTAGYALLEVWLRIERDQTTAAGLRSNATALWSTAEKHLLDPDPETGAHPVLFRAGRSLGETGLATQAAEHFHRLHATLHRRLGPDHPSTLATRSNLASWRGEAGDPAGAATADLATHRPTPAPAHPPMHSPCPGAHHRRTAGLRSLRGHRPQCAPLVRTGHRPGAGVRGPPTAGTVRRASCSAPSRGDMSARARSAMASPCRCRWARGEALLRCSPR